MVSVTAVDPLCFGSCDGTLTIDAINATQYSIDNGTSFQVSASFAGACSGTYDIVVQSSNGCEAVGNATVTDPAQLTLSIITQDAVCNGGCDGSINAVVNGGTVSAGYNYNWSGGIASSTDPNAINVCAGTYDLIVTDDNGCVIDSVFTLSQPLELSINATISNNACSTDSNGVVELVTTGGVGGISFQLVFYIRLRQ